MTDLNHRQVKGLYEEISKHSKYYLHRGEAILVEMVIDLAKESFKDDSIIQSIDIEKRGKTDELIREDAATALRMIVAILPRNTELQN